jgi:capsular polysaccharide biosynthesis protein
VAYHPKKEQAVAIASTVAEVLAGTGNDFAVNSANYNVVDTPVASKYPQKPNFPAIAVAAFLLGFFGTFVWSVGRKR